MIFKDYNRQVGDSRYFPINLCCNIQQAIKQVDIPTIQVDHNILNVFILPSNKVINQRVEALTYVDDIYCFCPPIKMIEQHSFNSSRWCCCPSSIANSSESSNFQPLKVSSENSLNHATVNQHLYYSGENNGLNANNGFEEEKSLDSENIIKISLSKDSESEDESFVINRGDFKNNKKSTQLKFRNDVIFKTIFRSFRKHCIRDFKTYFDFIKQKGDSIRLARKVKNYMVHRFGFENELLCAIFICIIDTRHKYSQVNENYEDVAAKINELMYNFSNNKMLELIDCDEFALIFQAFLRQPDIVNKVLKNRNDSPLKKAYKIHIANLLNLSSKN